MRSIHGTTTIKGYGYLRWKVSDNLGKTHVMRCTGAFEPDGRYHVRPVGAQGSHQLAATATADAVILVPDGDGLGAGDEVDALLLTG